MQGMALPRTGTLPLPLEEQESTGPLGRPRPRGNTPGQEGPGHGHPSREQTWSGFPP